MNTLEKDLPDDSYQHYFESKYKSVPSCDDYYYFYKYVSLEKGLGALGIINDCTLGYNNPVNFNDPYDCMHAIDLDFTTFNKEKFEIIADGKIKATNWIKKKNQIQADLKKQICKDLTKDIRKHVAVTCFSTDPLNILMWSHYADNHKGFLVEFKFPKEYFHASFLHLKNFPLPVRYTDEFPSIKLEWDFVKSRHNSSIWVNFSNKMLLTKAKCWGYENEFRMITDINKHEGNSLILKAFNPELISSLIIGSKISKDHQNAINLSVGNFNKKHGVNIKVYNSELMESKFALTVPKHPRLDMK
ncbi:DUF2971 domain-containing protein [Acinetobacter cumulans]|uniref:DUF2971 domain-containing protein n=1 Tax=Acinetobacter cumulans TaxID=2136182 RepID=UPI000EA225B5|nr:DUF2971 domain-containing protein [Acinetobacter cumulans]